MANNLIQIKRSTTTDAPPLLANGELAFSFTDASNSLFVGDQRHLVPGTPLRVAGGKYAFLHQAGTPGTLTSNAVIITDNNSFVNQFKTTTAVVGPVGTTNSLATFVVAGTAYISNNVTIAGMLNVNGGAAYSGGNTSFDSDTLFIDSTNHRVGITTNSPDTTLDVAGTLQATGNVNFGFNSVDTMFVDVVNHRVGILSNSSNLTTTLFVNGTSKTVGAATFANTIVVSGLATLASANVVGTLAVSGLTTFASNVNFDVGTLFIDSVNNRVGIGNTTPNASLTVQGTANVSGNTVLSGRLTTTGAAVFSNTITTTGSVIFSNTLNVTGATTLSNTLSVASNVAVDTNVLFVDAVNNRVGINTNTPSSALNVLGDVVVSANVTANNLIVNADATINGNLSINGTLTTIDTVNLVVEDSLFKVAKNNNSANSAGDIIDLGFYGSYSTLVGGTTPTDMFAGLFRDATNGKFRLFKDLQSEPTSVVDTASPTFAIATMVAYIESGALVSNSSSTSLTANSTYSVSVAANTLSLSSALGVSSGGTGVSSFTSQGIIYGNGSGALLATAAGANGDILQVVNNVPAFGSLDGGSF